jgi:putative ABC transport system ATP-binding protein
MSALSNVEDHGAAQPTAGSAEPALLVAEDIGLSFGTIDVLREVSLEIAAGSSIAIRGPSGCGKTTLLRVLSSALQPDQGKIRLLGTDLSALEPKEISSVRLRMFGYVFQFGELLPELTMVENIELPLRLMGASREDSRTHAVDLMEQLGIASHAFKFLTDVSGGEMQRAAIARAVIHRPKVVFADEPTGALDDASSETVFELLLESVAGAGSALIVATHDARLSAVLPRSYNMLGGRLIGPEPY